MDASTGALKDIGCTGAAAQPDTTRVKITGNKWTINSTGTSHQDIVFTKQ